MDALKWFNEHFALPLIVGLIIAVVVGGIGAYVQLSNSNARLEIGQEALSGRVDRIADALPGIEVKVAHEMLTRPVSGAVLFTNAQMTQSSFWQRTMHIMQGDGAVTSYKIPVDFETDDKAIFAILGKFGAYGANAMSAKLLQKQVTVAEFFATVPSYYDIEHSMVFWESEKDISITSSNLKYEKIASFKTPYSRMNWSNIAHVVSTYDYFTSDQSR